LNPSGRQLELAHGDQRAVVVEVGGGLRAYTASGNEVLDGYAEDELSPSGRGQVLLPWPNRLEDGTYEFDGRQHQLPLDEPERRNAIHGLVRWSAWSTAAVEPSRVAVEHTVHPRPGYPFRLEVRIEYELSDGGLAVRTTATNAGSGPCPFGCGAHPYLTLGTPTVDPLLLRVPGRSVLRSDERGLPTGEDPVDGGEYDFRAARAIGPTRLDHAYAELERDEDGLARAVLAHPDGGAAISLWADEAYRYLQVFTGDPLPDVARRSLAVEPMTCPPNAFRTGVDLIRLGPGESFTGAWGVAPGSSPRGDDR
jgi:aldose 1-epimerase